MAIDNYKLIKKTLIKTHNTRVARHFHGITKDDLTTGEGALRTASIIRSKDAALVILLKLFLFYFVLSNFDAGVVSIPESFDLKVNKRVPQLIIVFKPRYKKDLKHGYYQLAIPHYHGGKPATLPSLHKGDHYTIYTLRDNSQIHVYANSKAEGKRFVEAIKHHIDPAYMPGRYKHGELEDGSRLKIQLIPHRADFYPHGKSGSVVGAWRHPLY